MEEIKTGRKPKLNRKEDNGTKAKAFAELSSA